jgi:hypothetical protein
MKYLKKFYSKYGLEVKNKGGKGESESNFILRLAIYLIKVSDNLKVLPQGGNLSLGSIVNLSRQASPSDIKSMV